MNNPNNNITFSVPLVDGFNLQKRDTLFFPSNLDLRGKRITGLRLLCETDVNAPAGSFNGGIVLPQSESKKLYFNFHSTKTGKNTLNQIPADALICGRTSDRKKGYFYDVDIEELSLKDSGVLVSSPLTAPGAGTYYVLQLVISFE